MARDHARLDLNIWDKDDFRALSREAKLLYIQLFSQRKLSYAGVLDLAVKRWNRPHADLDLTEMRAALSELDAARFVVIDQDTEELLVRSFIRSDELYKQPNMLRGALRVAFDIESPILRAALAAELRRLPAHVTGPAPAIAANELEAGAPELPPVVKAAMTVRPSGRPSPAARPERPNGTSERGSGVPCRDRPVPTSEGSPNPSGTPSPNPSPKDLGEGSRERETGEPSFASRSEKVGLPARDAHGARPTRIAATTPVAQEGSTDDSAGTAASGSVRQQRRAEAERLVDSYGSSVPAPVRAQLVAQVIPLLRDGIGSNTIGAGLAAWSGKALPPTFLPMLVGERMRAARIATDPEKRAWDAEMVDRFESLRSAAIAEDDRNGVGLVVRQAQPRNADADQLTAILDAALDQAIA